MKRWGAGDDAKLITLWRSPHNGVDCTKLDKKSVQAVHEAYFPSTKYRNFATLYRNKARAFSVSSSLDGHRKRKFYFLVLLTLLFISHITLISSQDLQRQGLLQRRVVFL